MCEYWACRLLIRERSEQGQKLAICFGEKRSSIREPLRRRSRSERRRWFDCEPSLDDYSDYSIVESLLDLEMVALSSDDDRCITMLLGLLVRRSCDC